MIIPQMIQQITPSKEETLIAEDDFLVSKTDTKGTITYLNRNYLRISNYSETELLGQEQKIIRHPDMPRGLFDLLWSTVQSKQEFNGYVKNLRKDGGYFWVFTNITPNLSASGRIIGYYAIGRKPKKEAIEILEPLYKKMLVIEKGKAKSNATKASRGLLDDWLKTKQVECYEEYILSI